MAVTRIVVQQYNRYRLTAIPGYAMPIRAYYIERKVGRKWLQVCEIPDYFSDAFSDAVWALGRLEWPRIPQ